MKGLENQTTIILLQIRDYKMPTTVLKTSFTGGEWAPSLYGRTDLEQYANATRTMENFIIHPHGGASNRGGTSFIYETKDSTAKSRLVPFQFSVTQSYTLEFGNEYIRYIKDGGIITKTLTDTTAWTTGHDYVVSDLCKQSSIIYYCKTAHTSGTFATDLAAGKWYALTLSDVAGTFIYEIPTTYLTAHIPLLKFVQSADILYITHPSYKPCKLSRTGHTAWTLTTITFEASILCPTNITSSGGTGTNYKITTISAENGEESLPSSSVTGDADYTLTWDAVTGADYYNVYKESNSSGTYGWIGKATDETYKEPVATVTPDETKQPPNYKNPFDTTDHYPGCAMFFEQRLVFARTNQKPQTVWGSVTGSFESMNTSNPTQDDDAYEFTINARQVNEIRWLVALQELIIGSSSTQWKMNAGNQTDSVTPSSVSLKVQTQWGVSHVYPITIGNSVLFIERSGDSVRDLNYSLELDSYKGDNLTILANHLFKEKEIVEWAYQAHPDSIIYCVLDDGTMVGLTYYKEHKVWGWHRNTTDGLYESIAGITTTDNIDEIYVIVKRTIGGVTKRYIEKFETRITDSDVTQCWFVDCGLNYNSTAATVFSGLDHLEGKTVVVYADGSVFTDLVVTGGSITLPIASSVVYIGLPYTCIIETLDFDMPTGQNSTTIQDKVRNVRSVVLRMENTRELFVGPSSDRLYEIAFRSTELLGEPTALYSGDKEIFIDAGEYRQSRVYIKTISPVPCTILSLAARVEYGAE